MLCFAKVVGVESYRIHFDIYHGYRNPGADLEKPEANPHGKYCTLMAALNMQRCNLCGKECGTKENFEIHFEICHSPAHHKEIEKHREEVYRGANDSVQEPPPHPNIVIITIYGHITLDSPPSTRSRNLLPR